MYNIINVESLYEKLKLDSSYYPYDIVFVGRIVDPKDPFRLLEVCRLVINERKNARIAIVGSGDLEDKVKEKANELGLLNNISFLGFQTNPYKILFDSKVMLMTSKYEGTPMCALEAQALGVPIVSTPVDGMKELIKDGFNGYLTNDNNMLATYVVSILDSELLRQNLSNNARAFSIKHNDINRYREELLQVYRKLVK